MTATIADDLTETDRDKSCVCKDQGIANIDARLMGAMAGCTMIGIRQSGRVTRADHWRPSRQ